jgi:hypothetical protein
MAFNPLQSFLSGQQAGQMQQSNRLAGSVANEMQNPNFNPRTSTDFRQLQAIDPERASKSMEQFQSLSDERKKAYFDDMVIGRSLLQANDMTGFGNFINDRLTNLTRLGSEDASGTEMIRDRFNEGDVQGIIQGYDVGIQAGQQLGFLGGSQANEANVQSSKILEDGTIIQVLKNGSRQVTSSSGEMLQGDAAREAVKLSSQQSFNRKKELARLSQTIKREQAKEGLLTDQQTEIQRQNIKRLGSLSSTSTGRNAAVKKATKFQLAIQSGEVGSGASRTAASFIPGVFTSQAEFDQEFNAFAEVAARQQLKAAGETRPTNEDVEGMKNAMFGVGRDENVNVILLNDFIKAQLSQTQELDQLIEASTSGNLSNFVFENATMQQGKPLEDMTIEELQALRSQGGPNGNNSTN